VKIVIQQVTGAQVQQTGVQLLPVQQAGTGETFESLMKSASDVASKVFGAAGKTGSVKNAKENQEDTAQNAGTGQTPFSVFSLLGQNISTIRPVVSETQAAGGTQAGNVNPVGAAQGSGQSINLWQSIGNAANAIGSMGFAQANAANASGTAQAVNLLQNAGNAQTADLVQGVKSTQTLSEVNSAAQTANLASNSVNAGSNASDTVQSAQVSGQNVLSSPQVGSSGKTEISADTESNNPLQTFVSKIPGQPAQNSGSTLSVSAEQTDGIASAFSAQDGTFRTVLQKSETVSAEPKAASKNEQNQSDFAGKLQGTTFSEKKSNLSDTETASQNQGYADLFQTGNVIIPISANPEATAKSACSQVTDKIGANYRAGKSEFAIDLYPKDLGKVSVKLGVQNGVLTVEISAANPKTQSMLLANTDEIKSILQSSVNQNVQVTQPQEKAWYEQSQNQSNQSSAQQQEQQRQNREDRLSYSAQDDGSTEDFLSVIQQLSSV
jgi:flagellar hook-length control protein FliK